MLWILQKIVNLFYLLRIFYWMSLVGLVRSFIETRTVARCQGYWALAACKFLQVKLKKIPSEYEVRTQKTIFLINHRSQADFFIHPLILGGCTNFLGRQQVAVMFGIISLFVTNILWFFNRSKHVDIEKFNEWLDQKYAQTPSPYLVVYPQGHRMYGTTGVGKEQVKRGMIKYAFSRQIPIQFIMSFGNENAFNEKKLKISYGEQITYKIGKVIDPKDFKESTDFVNAAVEQFIRFFGETYNESQAGGEFEDTTSKIFSLEAFKDE